MPFGFFCTTVDVGLEYLAVGVTLFQKSALVVELYVVYPKSGFNKRLYLEAPIGLCYYRY